jgi:2,3-bisphosphoglycerate-dependent phosphoglycerate mutase
LSETGVEEAKFAGQQLKEKGFEFDLVYTSVLKRSIMTYNVLANELDCNHLPVNKINLYLLFL